MGDVLLLRKEQRVPIDSVLLHTSDPTGAVFVRTDQMDGETDWKMREAVRFTQALVKGDPSDVFDFGWNVVVEAPRDLIYEFDGNFFAEDSSFEPLRIENTVWANMRIASGDVLVLTVYTGRETRMALNSKVAVSKFGKTDREINFLFKLVFLVLLAASLFFFFASGSAHTSRWYVPVVRIFAILSTLLPFMLKLNVDFAKLFYAYEINTDAAMAGTLVRNTQIPEELGRVEYLLSDKTGTLTRNEMLFKALATPARTYGVDDFDELRRALGQAFKGGGGKASEHLREAVLGLLVCNNVSPTVVGGQRMLQASSPDEVALVGFAESLGCFMHDRKAGALTVRSPVGRLETFEVLENFPFSSERKRMGILVRNCEDGRLTFFLKGADSVVQGLVDSSDRIFLEEQCEGLSKEGLRTLVFAYRVSAALSPSHTRVCRRAVLPYFQSKIADMPHPMAFLPVSL